MRRRTRHLAVAAAVAAALAIGPVAASANWYGAHEGKEAGRTEGSPAMEPAGRSAADPGSFEYQEAMETGRLPEGSELSVPGFDREEAARSGVELIDSGTSVYRPGIDAGP